jgi:hypothetical protein
VTIIVVFPEIGLFRPADEGTRFFETSANTRLKIHRHFTEDLDLGQHSCDVFMSHVFV